jgi:hypothetical protein
VATGPGVFFVAPEGRDQWSGQVAQARGEQDGPFATLARAAQAVRELRQKQGGVFQQPVTVYLRGGTHTLAETWVLTPDLSGSSNCPVTFRAYPGETPVISGGRRVTGWQQVTVQGRAVWRATLPEVAAGQWSFHSLWVNDRRATRSRHPDQGYLKVEGLPPVQGKQDWTDGQAAFRYEPGALMAWPSLTNAEVRVMNRWVESHLPVAGLDPQERLIRFRKRSVFKLDPGDLYYVENLLEALDQPGEWCLDPAGFLYYLPRPGEDPARTEVIAPRLAQLVSFTGQPEAGRFVEQIRFAGLRFAHTEWYFPKGFDQGKDKAEIWPPPAAAVGGFAQAAIGVPGAVRGQGVRQVSFQKCQFTHLGGYGLELGRGCRDNLVARCEFSDLGAGGIKLGETAIRQQPAELAANNEVSDCHIFDGGRLFHSAIGIWVGQSPGNRLLHNHIHDFYYTGISLGWTWGYDAALATNSLVEGNHVHHIGVLANGDGPILSDMAGIYTLGRHTGSVIRNNVWHDSAGLRYGGWGIYFDEGTSDMVAENNLVYRTTHGGFHQHYGRDNIVRNNIFALARDFQIQRTRLEAHVSFSFSNNIVYWRQGDLLNGSYKSNVVFDANLYWQADQAPFNFGGRDLAAWQKLGQDRHARVADPLFVNPARDDFNLQPASPAFGLGFKALNLRGVGVRPEVSEGR